MNLNRGQTRDYSTLLSMFAPDTPPGDILVQRRPRVSSLVHSDAELQSWNGRKTTVRDVIASNTITVLMFGSPCYKKSEAMIARLKKLTRRSEELGLLLGVVYVPLYTYEETALVVEKDFLQSHGDWWMMGFQTWDAAEAVYMHGVSVVPTLVVLDQGGRVVTECGQNDLVKYGSDVLIMWF